MLLSSKLNDSRFVLQMWEEHDADSTKLLEELQWQLQALQEKGLQAAHDNAKFEADAAAGDSFLHQRPGSSNNTSRRRWEMPVAAPSVFAAMAPSETNFSDLTDEQAQHRSAHSSPARPTVLPITPVALLAAQRAIAQSPEASPPIQRRGCALAASSTTAAAAAAAADLDTSLTVSAIPDDLASISSRDSRLSIACSARSVSSAVSLRQSTAIATEAKDDIEGDLQEDSIARVWATDYVFCLFFVFFFVFFSHLVGPHRTRTALQKSRLWFGRFCDLKFRVSFWACRISATGAGPTAASHLFNKAFSRCGGRF